MWFRSAKRFAQANKFSATTPEIVIESLLGGSLYGSNGVGYDLYLSTAGQQSECGESNTELSDEAIDNKPVCPESIHEMSQLRAQENIDRMFLNDDLGRGEVRHPDRARA